MVDSSVLLADNGSTLERSNIMKLRFSYQDSESGEENVIDFDAPIDVMDETSGPAIVKAFSVALSKMTGEEEVDTKFESFVLCGHCAALTFREKVILSRGRHSYDILITGLVYSHFAK